MALEGSSFAAEEALRWEIGEVEVLGEEWEERSAMMAPMGRKVVEHRWWLGGSYLALHARGSFVGAVFRQCL